MRVSGPIIGFSCAIVGAILFSSKAIFIKLGYAIAIPTLDLLFLRGLFSVPFFMMILTFLYYKNLQTSLSKKDVIQLIGLGFIGYYLSSVLDFYGLHYIPASIERLILYTYPLTLILLQFILFRRRVNRTQLLSLIVTYCGLILVLYTQQAPSTNNILGCALVAASTVSYACYILLSGEIIPKIGASQFTAYVMIFSYGFMSVHYLFLNGLSFPTLTKDIVLLTSGLALVCTVIPTLLISHAIAYIGSANTSLAGGVGPLSTILLAGLILHETLTPEQWMGACLIVAGVSLLVLQKKTMQP